jgi:hypothetical protein
MLSPSSAFVGLRINSAKGLVAPPGTMRIAESGKAASLVYVIRYNYREPYARIVSGVAQR